ncbi:IS200/IS605 family transposase, partial [uncultured Duncaniella sp.]|uniref:IS200/IS605 family transposase n=1 Tax=uncultured Duncaniella sp. TaxID=2768039 RepID=UPI002632A705
MSYISSLYHVVFTTHHRKPVITNAHREALYRVIASEIKRLKCKAFIINGIQDHIHILLSLHPTVALSDMMRDVKSKSSVWAQASGLFPLFVGWDLRLGWGGFRNWHG